MHSPNHGFQETNAVHPNRLCRRMKIESKLKEYLSEIPCLVSSDVHEWRNDWGTVSRTCSVKIQYR